MPTYGFECEHCDLLFDIICPMDDIIGLKAKCPKCNSKKHTFRNFSGNLYICNATPTTIGALAERNGARMSADEIQSIQTKNRIQKPKFSGSLPKGGSLLPVDSKGKKIMPTKMGKNPRRPKNG